MEYVLHQEMYTFFQIHCVKQAQTSIVLFLKKLIHENIHENCEIPQPVELHIENMKQEQVKKIGEKVLDHSFSFFFLLLICPLFLHMLVSLLIWALFPLVPSSTFLVQFTQACGANQPISQTLPFILKIVLCSQGHGYKNPSGNLTLRMLFVNYVLQSCSCRMD